MENYDIKPFLYEFQTLLKESRVDEAEKCVDDLIESLEKSISEEKSGADNECEDRGDEGLFGFFGEEKKE